MKKYFFPLLLLLMFSCKSDDNTTTAAGIYTVDPDFEYYVQLFVEKGNERGANIDFSDTGLLVEYSDVVNQGASGWCFVGQHHIVIDKSEWDLLTEDEKVFLFAHELGHCELGRGHKNEQYSNGLWESLMRGDPLTTIQSSTPVAFYGFRQDYYWDELFNENMATPTWANQTFDYDEIPEIEKELLDEKSNSSTINEFPNVTDDNYEFEVEFNGLPQNSFLTEMTWGASPLFYKIKLLQNATVTGFYIVVQKNGFEQLLYYNPNVDTFNNTSLEKITIRQHEGFTKIFFNDDFIFHLDAFSNPLQRIQFDSRNNDNSLIQSFDIENYRLNKIL